MLSANRGVTSPRNVISVYREIIGHALLFAACGNDDDAPFDDANGPGTADDNGNGNGDNGLDGVGGDPDASTATFAGEDLDFHFLECQEQFDHDDRVEIRGRSADPLMPDHDPELELVLRVNERDDDASVRLTREAMELDESFDGHEWTATAAEVDIGWSGASATLELELSPGPDEEDAAAEGGDTETIEFDLVC